MTTIPPRFYWALECMQLKPGDSVLELGCGAGLLLSIICPLVTHGKVVGVDVSATMLARAKNRNVNWVENGRLKFLQCKIDQLKLQKNEFNKIVAFNLSIFFKADVDALKALTYGLKKGGELYIFYQPPFVASSSFMLPVIHFLTAHQFKIVSTQTKTFGPHPAFCVHAKK